jgi:hypothetical protein
MLGTPYSRALAVLMIGAVLLTTAGITQARADNAGRLLAGIVVGALVYSALDNARDCNRGYYCQPPCQTYYYPAPSYGYSYGGGYYAPHRDWDRDRDRDRGHYYPQQYQYRYDDDHRDGRRGDRDDYRYGNDYSHHR